jgi:uncharacterized protein YdeI (YjbR/CyaY-like superfamily)
LSFLAALGVLAVSIRFLKPKFFKTQSDLRQWFLAHHAAATEQWVGFYKKDSGKASITWPQSVDEALCFGWIDGIRKSIDDVSYMIRFTPRKPRSIWSAVNIKRAGELTAQDLMKPAGLQAFAAREENRSGIYSYEQRSPELPDQYAKKLKKNAAAWKFFQSQSPSYRKAANWWVVSAKKEETRLKRLEKLIEHSTHARTIPQFTPIKKPGPKPS